MFWEKRKIVVSRTKAFPWGKVDFPICPYRDELEKTDEG